MISALAFCPVQLQFAVVHFYIALSYHSDINTLNLNNKMPALETFLSYCFNSSFAEASDCGQLKAFAMTVELNVYM